MRILTFHSFGCRTSSLNSQIGSILLALHIAAAATAAEDAIDADRPGIAESSSVVGPGRFQIEAGIQQESNRMPAGVERTVFLPTLLRFGTGEDWELRVESDVRAWTRAGADRSEGYAPASLGVKYRFGDSAGPSQPALGAIVRIVPSSGSSDFRSTRTTGDLRFTADWEFAAGWLLNPNLGWAIEEDGAGGRFTATLFAVTLEYSAQPKVKWFVDAGLQSPEERAGRTGLLYDAGIAALPSRDVQLDFFVGARGSGVTSPRRFLGAGLSVRF